MDAMLDCSLPWQDVIKVLDCVKQCSLQLGGPIYRLAERDEYVMASGEWSSRGQITEVGPLSRFALAPQISYNCMANGTEPAQLEWSTSRLFGFSLGGSWQKLI